MGKSGFSRWGVLLAKFISGQIAVQLINLVTGFLILRILSVQEYAVYILVSLVVTIAAVGSDMGTSQGVISIGALLRDDKSALAGLAKSARILRRRFFYFLVPVVVVISYLVLYEVEKNPQAIIAFGLLALVTAWFQQSVALATALLNVHHDASGLTRAGVGAALFRLALVISVCNVAPFALTGLAINLVGMLLNLWMLSHNCKQYLDGARIDPPSYSRELLKFSKPLMPVVVYYLMQGQLALLLLGYAGATIAVAEVGALSRLGQVVGVLGMVNGFFVQPYFARILDLRIFLTRATQVLVTLFLAFGVISASTLILPEFWLAILGANYKGLNSELAIAMAGAQISVAGSVVYTLVIATRVTTGQWFQIAFGLVTQAAFLSLVGVTNTHDALMFNLVPATVYLALQLGLLARILLSWKKNGYPN